MAREHARILCRIWSDDDFRARSASAQRLYVLLLSQSGLNYCGAMTLTVQRWAQCSPDTTAKSVIEDLHELDDYRFALADFETEEILIRTFIRNDGVTKLPNVFKAALRDARKVHSARLRHELAKELRRLGRPSATKVADEIDPGEAAVHSIAHSMDGSSDGPRAEVPGHVELAHSIAHTKSLGSAIDTTIGSATSAGEGAYVSAENSPDVVGSVGGSGGEKNKRGTRIPKDFNATPEMVTWARERCPHVDGRRETEKFVNHWIAKAGKDAVKVDWKRTWMNWMLRAAEQTGQRKQSTTKEERVRAMDGLLDVADDFRALPPGGS